MRCEDVRRQLASDVPTMALSVAVVAHMRGCADCKRVQLAFEQIDQTLQRGPLWEPPEDFAARIAALAPDLVGSQTHRLQSPGTGALTIAASVVLVTVVGYLWVTAPAGQPAVVGALLANQIAAAMEAYRRLVGDMAQALVASSESLAWASVALSLGLGTWFSRRVHP